MSKIISLPPRLTSDVLAKYAQIGEASIVLKAPSIGDSSPYELHDDAGKFYIFKWSGPHKGHVLRVPVGIWMQNNAKMAHDLLDKHRLPLPLVVLVEFPEVKAVAPLQANAPCEQPVELVELVELVEPVEVVASDAPSEPVSTLDGSELMWEAFPLHSAISEAVKDKPVRLADLRTMFGVDDATLKAAINCPISESMLGHAGWVKHK